MGLEDMPTFLFAVFGTAVLAFFAYSVQERVSAELTPKIADAINATVANDYQTGVMVPFNMLDFGIGLFAIGMSVAMFAVAFISRSHPFFAPVAFLVQAGMLVLAWTMQGMFGEIVAFPDFTGIGAHFPITVWIMANFTLVTLIVSSIIIALNYIKPSSQVGVEA